MGEQGKACKDCNGYPVGFLCPIHAYFSRHELYKAGQDCWHPKGTALAWNEEEEKQGVNEGVIISIVRHGQFDTD